MLPIISNKVFLGYSYPSSLLTSEIIMPRQNPAAPQTFHLETPLLTARHYNSLSVLHRFFYLAPVPPRKVFLFFSWKFGLIYNPTHSLGSFLFHWKFNAEFKLLNLKPVLSNKIAFRLHCTRKNVWMLPIISNKVFLGYSYPSSLLTSEIIMPRQNPAAPQTFHLETPLLTARHYNSLLVLHRFFYLATDRRL